PGCIPSLDSITEKMLKLERAAIEDKLERVLQLLGELVPTFRPVDTEVATEATNTPAKKKAAGALRAVARQS
ncbi:MAG: hypothetical protein ACREQ7_17720, partial [Candidatus Binatia bacterium]